jgi:two-component system, LytTR family, response regulator
MKKLNCLIVDDEPIARQIIRNYCNQLPYLEVIDEAENAIEAIEILQKKEIDLLFLDINMPILNGLSFLKTLAIKPKVILTTAYKEYALDAFELKVADYLLKPIPFERFFMAVQAIYDEAKENNPEETEVRVIVQQEDFDGIFLKIGKTIFRYSFSKILFLEAQQNYTRVVTVDEEIRVYQPLSQLEEQLPAHFLRTHRSYIVNKNHVLKIDGNRIILGKHEVAIAPNQRELFFEKLGFKS